MKQFKELDRMVPLIIKRYNDQNLIAQMYQADSRADEDIIKDFSEIIDKIIIDIYLKDNVFIKDTTQINASKEEKINFVMKKRKEILKKMLECPFTQEEYINSKETSCKMTSCVKCCSLGIYEEAYYEWIKENPDGVYCDVCKHGQDDFRAML